MIDDRTKNKSDICFTKYIKKNIETFQNGGWATLHEILNEYMIDSAVLQKLTLRAVCQNVWFQLKS